MTRWKNPESAHCTRAVLFWHFAETLYRLMWHTECDRISEESRPVTHTNEPAVIALLHDADEISLLQLQLVVVLRHVAVQSLKSGAAWSREDTKCEISKGLSLPRILIRVWNVKQILLTFHSSDGSAPGCCCVTGVAGKWWEIVYWGGGAVYEESHYGGGTGCCSTSPRSQLYSRSHYTLPPSSSSSSRWSRQKRERDPAHRESRRRPRWRWGGEVKS